MMQIDFNAAFHLTNSKIVQERVPKLCYNYWLLTFLYCHLFISTIGLAVLG